MRLVLLSDTHNLHEQITVPEGDVLVHAGDFCSYGNKKETYSFLKWFGWQPHKTKILIAGNHELHVEHHLEAFQARVKDFDVIFLHDSGIEIGGLLFYGMPWTKIFYNWAFMLNNDGLMAKTRMIPNNTDILITHGPPFGIGDRNYFGERVGDSGLLDRVMEINPLLHIFGHVHGEFGVYQNRFVNASNLNEKYEYVNAPIVVDIDPDRKVIETFS